MEKPKVARLFAELTYKQQDSILTDLNLATNSEQKFSDDTDLFELAYNRSVEAGTIDTFEKAIQAKHVTRWGKPPYAQ